MRPIGWLLLPLNIGIAGFGFWLGRRYRSAIHHRGIGRPYSFAHSARAFLGDALVIIGLIGLLIAIMITFF
jgi:hypothetical protein